MSHSQRVRTSVALTAAALTTAALPASWAGTAHAAEAETCESATVQYRVADADTDSADADWTVQDGFHRWEDAPGTVEVRLAPGQTIADACEYPVSLAVYTTEGPDWESSGLQTFVEKDTVYLTAADLPDEGDPKWTPQELTVRPPDCYGQIDLYGDDITYDGQDADGHGPAPSYPEGIGTPNNLIAAWNGGDKECVPDEPDEPTPTPTPTDPADEEPPEETAPPTPEPTPPTSPEVPPTEPSPSPSPEPEPDDSAGELVETGLSPSIGLLAAGAALVMALGAGVVYAAKRRTRRMQS